MLILFVGIQLIVIDLVRTEKVCPKNNIVYRSMPRSVNEELESPAHVFKPMFLQSSPWINSIEDTMVRNRNNTISQ